MFQGSYIQVILDIAATDPHCKLSFVKSDIENARKELAELQSRPTPSAADIATTDGKFCKCGWSIERHGGMNCLYRDAANS